MMKKAKAASLVLEIVMLLFSIYYAISSILLKRYGQLLQPALVIALIIIVRLLITVFKRDGGYRFHMPALLFILMTKVLGNMWGFYSFIPIWDKLEHFLSGFLCAAGGLVIFQMLERKNGRPVENPKLRCWFIFFFAGAVAGWWELFEFSMDSWFNLHCQGGISDTMWDIIMGTLGGAIYTIRIFLANEKAKNSK